MQAANTLYIVYAIDRSTKDGSSYQLVDRGAWLIILWARLRVALILELQTHTYYVYCMCDLYIYSNSIRAFQLCSALEYSSLTNKSKCVLIAGKR